MKIFNDQAYSVIRNPFAYIYKNGRLCEKNDHGMFYSLASVLTSAESLDSNILIGIGVPIEDIRDTIDSINRKNIMGEA